jgi:serine/threonine protein kinase
MERADLGSLAQWVRSLPGRRVPEAEARRLFQQVILAVKCCHDRVCGGRKAAARQQSH